MSPTLEDICSQLDDTCLLKLNLAQKIMREKQKLEELMKDGYINMAKARYLMGPKTVGILQLPSEDAEVTAAQRVITIKNGSSEKMYSFQLKREEITSPKHEEMDSSLRRRTVGKTEKENLDESTFHSNNDEPKPHKKSNRDKSNPLNWFGVLVPKNLRDSQKAFQNSLEIVCTIAELQTELIVQEENFKELLTKKMEMLSIKSAES